jgi:hypothetical protein
MTIILRDKMDELEMQRIALPRRREELIDDLDELNKQIQVITTEISEDLSRPRP